METPQAEFLALRQTLYHLYTELFEETLRQFSLTQMEADTLLFLANNPRYDTAAELVEIRCLSKSQVSASVEHLVQLGYLRREPEGRRMHLRLTEEAGLVVTWGRACQARFRQTLLRGVSEEEQALLQDLLNRIVENARTGDEKWAESK